LLKFCLGAFFNAKTIHRYIHIYISLYVFLLYFTVRAGSNLFFSDKQIFLDVQSHIQIKVVFIVIFGG